MFQILGVWNEIFFSIISGLYRIVIKVYDIMMTLVEQDMDLSQFESLATTMYVLAGVFILFKVVIAMVQMILNPDLITDKQAGAGKLITRIVTCLILLIAFSPNGFLFGYQGLFNRIEEAVLADDGLITKMIGFESASSSKTSSSIPSEKKYESSESNLSDILIDNVYAADYYTCYYWRLDESATGTQGLSNRAIKEYYRIDFSKKKKTNGKTFTKIKNSNEWYYYSYGSSYKVGGKNGPKDRNGDNLVYTELKETLKVVNKKENELGKDDLGKDSDFSVCPKAIIPGSLSGKPNLAKKTKVEYNKSIGPNYPNQYFPGGLYGGTTTVSAMIKDAEKFMDAHDAVLGVTYSTNSEDIQTPEEREAKANQNYLEDIDPKAITFGQATASSLQECAIGSKDDCSSAQQNMFKSTDGDKEIVNLADEDKLDMGFMMSVVAGIGLIIYLLFLCVEVILRRLKLFFLEVMAPIPIISYVSPNDKTFSAWLKMYFSTYLDLFIKLIAISIAMAMIETISNDFWSTGNEGLGIFGGVLVKFFYIVAILVFAKVLPTMISKLFNLDSMGGSFKDIKNIATGASYGGAIGGITGAIYGAQNRKGINKLLGGITGGLGGAFSGIASGIGSGYAEKPLAGGQKVSAQNALRAQQRADGLNFLDRAAIAGYNKLGINPASAYVDQMKYADKVEESRGALDKWAKDELTKKGANFIAGSVNNGNAIMSKDKSRAVTHADEDINMKSEYKRQGILNSLTTDQWNGMSPEQRRQEFGDMVGSYNTLSDAQVFMDDRIAALEDFGKAIRINTGINDGDNEAIKKVNALKSSIGDARGAGVEISQIPEGANFDNKTLKNAKDQANAAYNKIGAQNEKAIARAKYVNNSKQ